MLTDAFGQGLRGLDVELLGGVGVGVDLVGEALGGRVHHEVGPVLLDEALNLGQVHQVELHQVLAGPGGKEKKALM